MDDAVWLGSVIFNQCAVFYYSEKRNLHWDYTVIHNFLGRILSKWIFRWATPPLPSLKIWPFFVVFSLFFNTTHLIMPNWHQINSIVYSLIFPKLVSCLLFTPQSIISHWTETFKAILIVLALGNSFVIYCTILTLICSPRRLVKSQLLFLKVVNFILKFKILWTSSPPLPPLLFKVNKPWLSTLWN